MSNDYLPIGTVVQLKGSEPLVMIAGYLPIEPSHPDYMWDYSGFRFPLGFDSTDNIYCFNRDQVAVIYAYGYRDVESDIFLERLQQARGTLEETVAQRAAASAEAAPETDHPDETGASAEAEGPREEGA